MNEKVERTKTSLQIEEDIDLHVTGWIAQRIGWGLMLSFVALAALGLFGNGFLSHESIARNGTTLEYERFTRRETNTQVTIQTESSGGYIQIAVAAPLLRCFKIEKIVPEPTEQRIASGSNVYVFTAAGEGKVTFYLTGQQGGDVNTTIAVNGADFKFHSFIYP